VPSLAPGISLKKPRIVAPMVIGMHDQAMHDGNRHAAKVGQA